MSQALKLSHELLPISKFPINLFRSLPKTLIEFLNHRILVQGFIMPNLVDIYQTIFLEKRGKPWNFPKNVLLILEIVINLFWSVSKASIESSETWNISSRPYNAKFVQQTQNHFSGKARQTLKFSKNIFSILERSLSLNLFWSLSKA